MDIVEEKQNLIKSYTIAIRQLDKLIRQEIHLEEQEPEKAKQAAQGKIEAGKGYRDILSIIEELKIEIENEQNARKGTDKAKTFSGAEGRAR